MNPMRTVTLTPHQRRKRSVLMISGALALGTLMAATGRAAQPPVPPTPPSRDSALVPPPAPPPRTFGADILLFENMILSDNVILPPLPFERIDEINNQDAADEPTLIPEATPGQGVDQVDPPLPFALAEPMAAPPTILRIPPTTSLAFGEGVARVKPAKMARGLRVDPFGTTTRGVVTPPRGFPAVVFERDAEGRPVPRPIPIPAGPGREGVELVTPPQPIELGGNRRSLSAAANQPITATDAGGLIEATPPLAGTEAEANQEQLDRARETLPGLLRRPVFDGPPPSPRNLRAETRPDLVETFPPLQTPRDPPLGFTGPSGVLPTEVQGRSGFAPIEDRWRLGFPAWDRYGTESKLLKPEPDKDRPYELGRWWDPYNQNVFKGDYPIQGHHLFFEVDATSLTINEARDIPTATTPRDSTVRPGQFEFFGRGGQYLFNQFGFVRMRLFHGAGAFKPVDWQVVLTPAFNVNYLLAQELGVVSPDVLAGTQRLRSFFTLQEWFVETKLADTSPYFDTLALRVGQQFFNADFRGHMFVDVNRGVRLFGSRNANRDQFNLAVFLQAEKDTNSGLNTFHNRGQTLVIANYYRQDFGIPGYTASWSFLYNNDQPSLKFDTNRFLVRPDPVGVARPHEVNVFYLGFGGDGHLGRYNLSHQFYWALGYDELNPLANRATNISAQFFACELSYDRDWARFRTSFLYASGDGDANDGRAGGFDSILDLPNFAGGRFSFFQRQPLPLFGVNLTQRESFVTNLRSSKTQGQSNFVNPGLLMPNVGLDMDLTPQLKLINNCNFLWFHKIDPLKQFLFSSNVNHFVGVDLSTGLEWRPLLSNNIIVEAGVNGLLPGLGFRTLYNDLQSPANALVSGFVEVILTY